MQYQECDLRGKAVEVPLIYDAFTFSTMEQKYGTYKRELCAIVKFAQKYHYMLHHLDPGKKAIIHIDHKPLIHFICSDLLDGIYATWVSFIRPLNVEIQYIPGKKNCMADGLSRTLFYEDDCLNNNAVRDALEQFEKQGP